ncbi:MULTISPECIES: 50S ribosomal protein L31 [unclassified Adlercreutzia]|uniref:50S ribosomal protein L31 n=1 Tax=unclassified Adlercreutzia TaxID=2636013 RepID=UPI0013EC082E|nr:MULTISPECIES: 50S ribosomal protein L31 [unclassified Adlercreutzia]
MKQGIHPKYVDCVVKCSCGNTFTTRSTKPELKIDICNACHPFYTGTQKLIDTGGRVQRFADRFGSAKNLVAEREAAKKAARAAEIAEREAAKKAEREAKAAKKAERAAAFAAKAAEEAAKAEAAAAAAEPAAEEAAEPAAEEAAEA